MCSWYGSGRLDSWSALVTKAADERKSAVMVEVSEREAGWALLKLVVLISFNITQVEKWRSGGE